MPKSTFQYRRFIAYLCRVNEFIEQLKQRLESPLPGWPAQAAMVNYARPTPTDFSSLAPDTRQGAVLALLYPKNGEIHTVLTLRHTYRGVHSGQVSFPGGGKEPSDQDLWHTALREAKEEVGISPERVRMLGELTKVYIPPSRFLVSPFLAYSDTTPQFERDPVEVNRVLEAPLSAFIPERNIRAKKITLENLGNLSMKIKYFDVDGETVWGATAMILSEIRQLVRDIKPA